MNRYIDVDEFKEMIEARAEMLVEGKEAFYYIANWLNKLPPADVVEIVRCKDCRHYVAEYCTRDIKSRTNMFYMCADDFCSYGERKDENDR